MVSVIIVTYKSEKWLPRCLESLASQTCDHEVIIIENTPENNRGFVAANEGARMARGEWLYIMNPDAWLEPNALEQFVRKAEQTGAAACGGTMCEYGSDKVLARGSSWVDVCGEPRGRPEPLFCIAGFLFIKRETFLALGGFDERLFMYSEEMDIAWRLAAAGLKTAYAENARCHHDGQRCHNRRLANRNRLVVIWKNVTGPIRLVMSAACMARLILEGLVTLSWRNSIGAILDAIKMERKWM